MEKRFPSPLSCIQRRQRISALL